MQKPIDMEIKFKKTKLMVFNAAKSIDFLPKIEVDNHPIDVVEEVKMLGLIVRSDLKWG